MDAVFSTNSQVTPFGVTPRPCSPLQSSFGSDRPADSLRGVAGHQGTTRPAPLLLAERDVKHQGCRSDASPIALLMTPPLSAGRSYLRESFLPGPVHSLMATYLPLPLVTLVTVLYSSTKHSSCLPTHLFTSSPTSPPLRVLRTSWVQVHIFPCRGPPQSASQR